MGTTQTVNGENAPALTPEEMMTNSNAIVLANAGELASGIVSEIAGNDMSSSINGSRATVEVIQNLVYQRMARRIDERQRKR